VTLSFCLVYTSLSLSLSLSLSISLSLSMSVSLDVCLSDAQHSRAREREGGRERERERERERSCVYSVGSRARSLLSVHPAVEQCALAADSSIPGGTASRGQPPPGAKAACWSRAAIRCEFTASTILWAARSASTRSAPGGAGNESRLSRGLHSATHTACTTARSRSTLTSSCPASSWALSLDRQGWSWLAFLIDPRTIPVQRLGRSFVGKTRL